MVECKGCGYDVETCNCEELKDRLEYLLEELGSLSNAMGLNFAINVNTESAKVNTWKRGIKGIITNEYFNLEV